MTSDFLAEGAFAEVLVYTFAGRCYCWSINKTQSIVFAAPISIPHFLVSSHLYPKECFVFLLPIHKQNQNQRSLRLLSCFSVSVEPFSSYHLECMEMKSYSVLYYMFAEEIKTSTIRRTEGEGYNKVQES